MENKNSIKIQTIENEELMKQSNKDLQIFDVDEYELHDLLASLYHLNIRSNVENEPVEGIRIISDKLSEDEKKTLEDAVAGLLEHMKDVDCTMHDIAEYACG